MVLPDLFTDLKAACENLAPDNHQQLWERLDKFLKSKRRRKKSLTKLEDFEAEQVVDLLDTWISKHLNNDNELRRRVIYALRSISGLLGVLPTSYTLQGEVPVLNGVPVARGGYGSVWCSTLGQDIVAVKVINTNDPDKLKKQLSKEAIIWKRLEHINVLPLLGVFSIKLPDSRFLSHCLVSPWMENGCISTFTNANPTFNRFKLLVDVCKGLIYLHQEGFSHGDLKGDNVLIDSQQRACLADFGLSRIVGVTHSSGPGGTLPYMAPELFKNDLLETPLQKELIDIFSLGTLIHEVLSGQRPFHEVHPEAIRNLVGEGTRLKKPYWTSIPNDPIWVMVDKCRANEPNERPGVSNVLERLVRSSITPPAKWLSPPKSESPSGSDIFPRAGPLFKVPASPLNRALRLVNNRKGAVVPRKPRGCRSVPY